MTRCRAWQKRIPEALYGDLEAEARGALDRHLASCRRCSELYRAMAETVKLMDVRPAPDREEEFWEGFWGRLSQQIPNDAEGRESVRAGKKLEPAGQASMPRPAFSVPRWVFGTAGAALLLALGIFLGRNVFAPRPGLDPAVRITAAKTPTAGPSLDVRASRYLRRSRVILLAVVNTDPQGGEFLNLSLPSQKKSSEELVREAAGLKKELRRSDPRLERLVSDLELILLQIANLKPQADASAVEVIKAGIESRDIFFKINLSEIRRSNEDKDPGKAKGAPGAGGNKPELKTAL